MDQLATTEAQSLSGRISAPPTHNRRVTFTAHGGPANISMVTERRVADPGPMEARIRVEASSLVFTDMLIRRNLYPMLKAAPGEALGYDLVGIVESLGAGAEGPPPGTRVAALTQTGGNQDWISLPVSELVPVPAELDPVLVEPLILSYMTAWQCLTRKARLAPGDRVLVIAASGAVGLAALDIARALGLQATGVASSGKRSVIEKAGAEFVPYDRLDSSHALDRFARKNGGFAAILDGAGSEPLRKQLARLAPHGHYVAFGFADLLRSGNPDGPMHALVLGKLKLGARIANILLRQKLGKRVHFYDITGLRKLHPVWFSTDFASLCDMLRQKRISPVVAQTFPPERAVEAHAMIEAGSVSGRLVLDLRNADAGSRQIADPML